MNSSAERLPDLLRSKNWREWNMKKWKMKGMSHEFSFMINIFRLLEFGKNYLEKN